MQRMNMQFALPAAALALMLFVAPNLSAQTTLPAPQPPSPLPCDACPKAPVEPAPIGTLPLIPGGSPPPTIGPADPPWMLGGISEGCAQAIELHWWALTWAALIGPSYSSQTREMVEEACNLNSGL